MSDAGHHGELLLLNFLNKYLPASLKAVTGYFITPSENLSPQIDILIVDPRYPFLSFNLDGTILAPLHSVLQTIEVKTSLTGRSIQKLRELNEKVVILSLELFDAYEWESVRPSGFGFRSNVRFPALHRHFFDAKPGVPLLSHLDVLRLHERDVETGCDFLGAFLWHEGGWPESSSDRKEMRFKNATIKTKSPLSDFYFRLVQDSLYTLSRRNYSLNDIGRHMCEYMTYGTASNSLRFD